MSTEKIRVMVTIDTDELREWAGRHADAGRHGVAHVLYKAANEGESLGEQAIREAKAEALREAAHAIESGDVDHEELRRGGVDDLAPRGWSDGSVIAAHDSGSVWATWLRARANEEPR